MKNEYVNAKSQINRSVKQEAQSVPALLDAFCRVYDARKDGTEEYQALFDKFMNESGERLVAVGDDKAVNRFYALVCRCKKHTGYLQAHIEACKSGCYSWWRIMNYLLKHSKELNEAFDTIDELAKAQAVQAKAKKAVKA